MSHMENQHKEKRRDILHKLSRDPYLSKKHIPFNQSVK